VDQRVEEGVLPSEPLGTGYLYVIFDKRIRWRLHIEMIEVKAFRTFTRIYSLFKRAFKRQH
jgi:hypothetical protein